MKRPYCKSCGQTIDEIKCEGTSSKDAHATAYPCGHEMSSNDPSLPWLLNEHLRQIFTERDKWLADRGLPPLHEDILKTLDEQTVHPCR